MKRLTSLFLAAVLIFALCACEKQEGALDYEAKTAWVNRAESEALLWGEACNEALRMKGDTQTQHLPLFLCESEAALLRFKEKFDELLDFTRGYDEAPSFNVLCSSYDEKFFEEHTLFLVYVSANSGSLRFGVESVAVGMEMLTIQVEQVNHPENVTDDMAGWLIAVTLKKADLENCTQFDAVFAS